MTSPSTLTRQSPVDKIPFISMEGVNERMKGTIDEYRPGRWRVRIYWKGKRIAIYHSRDGKILEGPKGAIGAQVEITQQVEHNKFNPTHWKKPREFLLKNAFEAFQR